METLIKSLTRKFAVAMSTAPFHQAHRNERGDLVLKVSPFMFWLALSSLAAGLLLCSLPLLTDAELLGEERTMWYVGVAAVLLYTMYCIAVLSRKIVLSEGVLYSSGLLGSKELAWDEIEGVGYTKWGGRFVVQGRYDRLHIPFHMKGVSELLQLLRNALGEEACREAVTEYLRRRQQLKDMGWRPN
jgi:hypothetical protein